MRSVKIGSQVSFLFRSERSKIPTADASLDIMTTAIVVPQIKMPPIVGVPFFLR